MNWRDLDLGINQSPDGFGSDEQQVDDIKVFDVPSEKELKQKIRGGAAFLMADGTVRFINDTSTPRFCMHSRRRTQVTRQDRSATNQVAMKPWWLGR